MTRDGPGGKATGGGAEPPQEKGVGPVEPPREDQDPLAAAREALARARQVARSRGLAPGRRTQAARRRGAGAEPGGGGGPGRDPRPVTEEVQRLLSTRGWEADVQVGAVVGRWGEIVGPAVADHVEPVSFTEQRLTVQADSTAWATQMRLLVSSVLARIEAEVGEGVVTEIIVKGPGGPTWRKGPLRIPGRGPRDTYG